MKGCILWIFIDDLLLDMLFGMPVKRGIITSVNKKDVDINGN